MLLKIFHTEKNVILHILKRERESSCVPFYFKNIIVVFLDKLESRASTFHLLYN
jgi:hypothetical protein